jgi:hypothetical protein
MNIAARATGLQPGHGREGGMVLLAVLAILFAVSGSASAFIWYMQQQQSRAGARMRAAAALSVAEAGIHQALARLEEPGGDGRASGREWRPRAHSNAVRVGSLEGTATVSIADDHGGALVVTSTGEVAGVRRRLRVRVVLTSPALLAAIYGASFVRLDDAPASTTVTAYGGGIGDRPWIHLAAGRQVWFGSADVAINDPAAAPDMAPGPVDPPSGNGPGRRSAGPVRILLARDGDLVIGPDRQRTDVDGLRALGVYIDGAVFHAEALPAVPEVNGGFYRQLARANTRNAVLNRAAGEYAGETSLTAKSDSVYSARDMEQLLHYMRTGRIAPRMQGVVYVEGGVALLDAQTLRIADGALMAEGTIRLGQGSVLDVTHTAASRSLPGLVALERGAIVVNQSARLRVHGLVYASRVFEVTEGSHVDVVGGILSRDAGLSIRNHASTLIVRYDPAVMGTPGLLVGAGDPVVAWVAGWEELP